MRVERFSAPRGLAASLLIVLIPGANQELKDLKDAGFVAAARERRLPVDLALVAPEQQHLTDRSALVRLHDELVLPARSSGSLSVWLTGISWGGYLSLLYGAEYAAELDGICLLSPYLGNRMINAEIGGFASLTEWSAGTFRLEDDLAEERRIWRYIASQKPHPPLIRYLGFGRDDRFAMAQRLLAAQLPAEAVDVIDGGHDDTVSRQLWDRLLDRVARTPPVRCSA